MVSTLSRLKAAGYQVGRVCHFSHVSTLSRLKAAGFFNGFNALGCILVSTLSRLKAAGQHEQ